ncbi:hypothetical protein BH10PSE16_BH10PSE16_17980 [soil metagenome]
MTDPRQQMDALSRINRIAVGNGLRIISLEQEVNELCRQYGQPLRYAPECEPDTKWPVSGPAAVASQDGLMPLDAVLCTRELTRRPARTPDYEAENQALTVLVQTLADSPKNIFQTLADTLLQVFRAGSAGISLLTRDEHSFYWPAMAGAWQAHQGGGMPRDFSPCGDTLDRNTPLLFSHPEQRYPYLLPMKPLAQECLLLPFYVKGKAVGTIWVVAHDAHRQFDAEDLRQLVRLGRFAAAAYQTAKSLDAAFEQGQIALGLMEDAVCAHQAIEKLRQSEEHYRTRFESIDEGFCIIERVDGETLDFRYVEANLAFAAQTGLRDVVGKTLRQVMPDEFEERQAIYDTVSRTGEPVKLQRQFGAQGRVLELYAFRVESGMHSRVAINFQDITLRAQAEEKLARQAEELASLYSTAPVGLCMFDTELRYVRINQAMADFNGLSPVQHIGRSIREFLTAELADSIEPLLRQVLDTGRPVLNREMQGSTLLRSGEQCHWLVSVHPVQAEGGAIRGVHGVVQEITQRKQAEEALRESQRFLRSCLDALSGHIAVLDASGTILEINEAWSRFAIENQATCASVGANYLQHCGDLSSSGGETPVYAQGIRDVIAGRQTHFEMEYPCHSPTQQRWFVMRVTRFQSPGPVRVVIVHDDCTEQKLAENAARQSEERYRNLFNLMEEGFCILEMMFDDQEKAVDFRFLEVNPAFSKQTGMHHVKGKKMSEFPLESVSVYLKVFGKVALTGESTRFVHEEKGFHKLWFDIYAVRLGGRQNPKIAIVFNNITKRTRAEEALRHSEQRFRALFDRGPVAMYCCDASGMIEEFNSCAVQLWGREPKRRHVDDRFCGAMKLYRPDGTLLSHAQSPMASVLNGEIPGVHDAEAVMERPDGSRITVIANIVPLRNSRGDIAGAISCFYDITERSRLERKTQEQAQALVELHQRKDEFLAMLSHELRNPLAPLVNAVQLLRHPENEAPQQRQALDIIERQTGQLTHLVDDLMDISRITSGSIRLRPERVSVGEIVERALETARPLIVQRRHELTVSLPPQPVWLHADATRLEQVLVNLLINAAKYTEEGGRIWLSVAQQDAGVADAAQPMAVIRVRDTGIGIAPELLPRIFELFTQAERSIDRSQGGLGIGLCLVQRLVALHAGSVSVHSVPGQGSEFVVRLPVMQADMPQPRFIEPASPAGKGCRVLAVDDNVDAVRSLAALLKMSGHEVQMAYDGPSALEAARAMQPDVILLDIGLPGLTGYEVAEQIRQDAALRNIVLVALTGYGREADRQLSAQAGFDHHLVKPADFREVEKILALVSGRAALPGGKVQSVAPAA